MYVCMYRGSRVLKNYITIHPRTHPSIHPSIHRGHLDPMLLVRFWVEVNSDAFDLESSGDRQLHKSIVSTYVSGTPLVKQSNERVNRLTAAKVVA